MGGNVRVSHFRSVAPGFIASKFLVPVILAAMPTLLLAQTTSQKATTPKDATAKAGSGLRVVEYQSLNAASTMKDFKRLFRSAKCGTGCGADDKFAGAVPAQFQAMFENAGGRISSLTVRSEKWNRLEVIAALDKKFGKHETIDFGPTTTRMGSEKMVSYRGPRHTWACSDGEIVFQMKGHATVTNNVGFAQTFTDHKSEELVYKFRGPKELAKPIPADRPPPKVEASKL